MPNKPTRSTAKLEFNDETDSTSSCIISRNSENSKRAGRSVLSAEIRRNTLDQIKTQQNQATDNLVNLQEAKILGTDTIQSRLALELEQEKKRRELEFAAAVAALQNKAKQEQLALNSRLELEALKYRSELNHGKNLEREFVSVHSREENSYIAKSNSDRSIDS